jgi:hypothetical protein
MGLISQIMRKGPIFLGACDFCAGQVVRAADYAASGGGVNGGISIFGQTGGFTLQTRVREGQSCSSLIAKSRFCCAIV